MNLQSMWNYLLWRTPFICSNEMFFRDNKTSEKAWNSFEDKQIPRKENHVEKKIRFLIQLENSAK